MLIIWRIFVLCFIVEFISSEPQPVQISRDTHDVAIQTDIDTSPPSAIRLLLQSLDEIKLINSMVNNLIIKLNTISPSSSANKPIHNGLLSNLCIISYVILTFILILRKH
ncbi:unnamed protein product [Schistosoma spindalis]|nr:unnamed protein product [Schistosoma spindale]